MDDKRSGNNIFQLYGAPVGQTDRGAPDGNGQEPDETYEAWVLGEERQPGLIFYDDTGLLRLLPHRDLHQVLCAPPGWLALLFTDLVVTLEGNHLTPLVKYLQREHLSELYCFSGDASLLPDDGETPVITQMRFQSYAEAAPTAEPEPVPEGE